MTKNLNISYPTHIEEKIAIIIDIGTAFSKIGFAGEESPRYILPTATFINANLIELKNIQQNEAKMKEFMISFFYDIYYRKLLINPKDRRVLLVESLLAPSWTRNLLGSVLFQHFQAPSVLFAPAPLLSVFPLGCQTGLVLDIGYSETSVVPVVEGNVLLHCTRTAADLGTRSLHRHLADLLRNHAKFVSPASGNTQQEQLQPQRDEEEKERISESAVSNSAFIEDLAVRACFVTSMERATKLELPAAGGGDSTSTSSSHFQVVLPAAASPSSSSASNTSQQQQRRLTVPSFVRQLAPELAFFWRDQELLSLTTLLLDTLLGVPIDCVRPLAQNIVVCGGGAFLPGLKYRLKCEIAQEIAAAKEGAATNTSSKTSSAVAWQRLSAITPKWHKLPCQHNCAGWLGGSIFAALDSLAIRSISSEAYAAAGNCIPDWTPSEQRHFQQTQQISSRVEALHIPHHHSARK